MLHSVGWKVEAWPGSLQVCVCLAVGAYTQPASHVNISDNVS